MLALQNEFKVKSEKTKVKFAQSNINHVYKGNTTEVHHKPAVRQYGMQLVGKLQGTRRLPPPAWVPSLKAETGGLDSRVSLVPSGGGGWGAPATSTHSETATPIISTMPTSTSNNGVTNSDASCSSMEPAYIKSSYVEAATSGTDSLKKALADTIQSNDPSKTSCDSGSSMASRLSSVTSKTQLEKCNSGGGLAANKPFFQRPTPVVTTSNAPTSKSDVPSQSVKSVGGARDIVGEPSGWAAIDHDEPNFDEHIVFSDEEDIEQVTTDTTTNKQSDHMDVTTPTSSTAVTTTVFSAKSFSTTTKDSSRPVLGYSSFPNVYVNNANPDGADSWSQSDMGFGMNCLGGQSLSRHPTQSPFNIPPVSVSGGVTSAAQFIQHPMSAVSRGLSDTFYSHLPQSRIVTQTSNSIVDPARPTDIDTELLHAQRQARTQEFNTAVERAQQARAARQKQSDGFSVDSEGLLARHSFNTNPNSENRTVSSISSGANATTSQGNNFVLPTTNRISVNALLNNVLPPQVLYPSTYQQTTGHSPDIAAAVAAATAAALAYGGGQSGGAAGASSENNTPSVAALGPHVPNTPTSNPRTMNPWNAPFVSAASTSAAIAGVLSQHPHLSQMLQNILAYPPSDVQRFKGAGQSVYIDTNFFFERFLEIINQQQQANRPPSVQNVPILTPKNVSSTDTAVQASSTTTAHPSNSFNLIDSRIKNHSEANITTTSQENYEGAYINQDSDKIDRNRRPKTSQLSTHPGSTNTANTAVDENSAVQRNTRVPGLMDVKVSCATTQHLAHIWDKEDYSYDSNFVGSNRGRGKHIHSYKAQRGGAKSHASNRSYYTESLTNEFKSLNTHDSSDPASSTSESHFHPRSKKETRSNSQWTSSKQRYNADESSRDATFVSTKSKSALHDSRQQPSCVVNHETVWSHSDTEKNILDAPSSSDSGTDECDDLSDVVADVADSEEKYKEQEYDKSTNQRSSNKHQRTNHYSENTDSKDSMTTYRNDYNRRTRRGRGSQNTHFTTSSRTYNTDGYLGYSSRYTKGSEYDYYSLHQQYGNPTVSHRSSQLGQRKTRTTGTKSHRQTGKGSRNGNSHGYSTSGNTGNYFNNRTGRSHNQYEQDHSTQFTDGDSRRHVRSQKSYSGSSKGQFSTAADYYADYHYSDGECSKQRPSRNHVSDGNGNISHRNYENSRFYKSYRKNQSYNSEKLRDHAEVEEPKTVADNEVSKKVVSENQDHSYIPTASNNLSTADSSRQIYSHPRHNRSGGGSHKSIGLPRRTNNRSNQNHQLKRSDGQLGHGSRRYRETRDRYNDEKDGDGGASAGGTGRSTTGGGNSSSYYTSKETDTGGGGNSNTGGNQCGGGQTDSMTVNTNAATDCVSGKDCSISHTDDTNTNNALGSVSIANKLHHNTEPVTETASLSVDDNSAALTSRITTRPSSFTYGTSKTERFSSSGKVAHENVSARGSRSTNFYSRKSYDNNTVSQLKTHCTFPQSQRDFDNTWCTNSGEKYFNNKETVEMKKNDTIEDFGEVHSDNGQADGFTKVVSKASRNFARRRLQQQLFVAGKVVNGDHPRSSNRYASHVSQQSTVQDNSPHSKISKNVLHDSSKQQISVSQKAPTVRKNKPPLPTKLTFMGPPMCLTSATPLSTSIPSTPCTTTCVLLDQSGSLTSANNSSGYQSSVLSKTHTWSKVVGTRSSVKSIDNALSPNQVAQKANSSSVLIGPNPIWQNELNRQIDSPLSKSAKNLDVDKSTNDVTQTTTVQAVVPVSCNTIPSDTMTECDYISMQSLWSSKDANDSCNKIEADDGGQLLLSTTSAACSSSTNTVVSTISLSTTQTSNNICKVKPQQQSLHISSTSSLILAPMINGLDNVNGSVAVVPAASHAYQPTDVSLDNERLECECNGDQSNMMLRHFSCDTLATSNRALPSTWSSAATVYPPFSVNQQLSNLQLNGHDNLLSSGTWPVIDQNLDINANCLTGTFNLNANQSHYQHTITSNVLSNLLASNSSLTPIDGGLNKQSNLVNTTRHPHIQQPPPYQQSIIPSTDPQVGLYSTGPYRTANGANDLGKLSSNNLCVTSKPVPFTQIATPSMFVHPQSSSIQSQCSRSYHPSLSVSMQHSQMSQPQKCRQRVTAPHLDPSTYASYANYPDLLQNEYTLPPGYVQTAPTGGLYSTIQTQTQPNYPQNPGRQPIPPSPLSNGNPWSLLGNPTATSTFQAAGQTYLPTVTPNAGTPGPGLLPHPVPQGAGFGNLPCHFPSTTNHAPSFANPPNYVGVIGGGRTNTDHSSVVSRQRNLPPHGLYPHPNLSQSPSSAQVQQPFSLHTAAGFYPSLSPSHQRVPIAAQFGNSQARVSLPGHINSQAGLYAAAAFGGASHSPNQPTPPPPINHQLNHMNFFNNPFQYPTRPGEHLRLL